MLLWWIVVGFLRRDKLGVTAWRFEISARALTFIGEFGNGNNFTGLSSGTGGSWSVDSGIGERILVDGLNLTGNKWEGFGEFEKRLMKVDLNMSNFRLAR